MKIVAIAVKLTLQGPILTGATSPGALGVDAPFARTRAGELYLPGTLVKGKLRQAWRALSDYVALPPGAVDDTWLGAPAGNTKHPELSFDPSRGRAQFTDFPDRSSIGRSALRSRIKMDEGRGAADDGMLQLLESPYASGEQAVFEGIIHFIESGEEDGRQFLDAVRLGLSAVPSFGAERGIGFGRLCSVEVSVTPQAPADVPEAVPGAAGVAAGAKALGLILTGNELLCFARRQPSENLFDSVEVISGAVLKGAIAQMMAQLGGAAKYPLLWAQLSRIRFRHARPGPKGEAPELAPAIPLSIVFAKGEWYDAAPRRAPCLVRGEAPAFQPDWKDDTTAIARRYFGHCPVARELRVRTHIDAEKRRALDENLFAYESLDPTGLEWRTVLDLQHVPENMRSGIRDELESLLGHGVLGLGKTKARMNARICDPVGPRFVSDATAHDPLVIQLHTPALLGLPGEWQAARSAADVHAIYSRAWGELSAQVLTLSHCFAAQELAGGLYLHRRFQANGAEYQPWLLTSGGSVFVFEANGQPGVQQLLEGWLETGLPITPSLREHYQLQGGDFDLWSHCPFVPENGFGEVGVNLHLNWGDRLLEVENA